jgi:hypothetical protein
LFIPHFKVCIGGDTSKNQKELIFGFFNSVPTHFLIMTKTL